MLAENLKSLLKNKEMSVTELARKSGVPKTNLLAWQSGNNPRIEQLLKVANFFGVTVDFLLTGEEPTELDRATKFR